IDIRHEGQLIRLEAAHSDPVLQQKSTGFLNRTPDLSSNEPVAKVIATGRPLMGEFTNEVAGGFELPQERRDFIRSMNLKSFMSVPLLSRGDVLGAITFVSPTLTAYQDAELRMAEQLADRVAVALDNSRLYTELQKSDRLKDEFLATMSHELR